MFPPVSTNIFLPAAMFNSLPRDISLPSKLGEINCEICCDISQRLLRPLSHCIPSVGSNDSLSAKITLALAVNISPGVSKLGQIASAECQFVAKKKEKKKSNFPLKEKNMTVPNFYSNFFSVFLKMCQMKLCQTFSVQTPTLIAKMLQQSSTRITRKKKRCQF